MMTRNPKQVKNDLTADSFEVPDNVEVSRGERGAITGRLNKAMGGDINRRTALAWLFENRGEMSSKTLTNGQWFALWGWIGFYQDEMNEWQTKQEFPVEAALVLTEALRAQSKVKASDIDADLAAPSDLLLQSVAVGGVITSVDGNLTPTDAEVDIEYWLKKKINAFMEGKDDL